ncbi:hypothetical protein VFMJ11_1044 [Aliivibrio fischeri MJ11]|uniref:Uncharacterized protein n=1 Tax=Aliivibrio fischeri (strain MJ11) TaxID=388396 RepID=B5FD47_ALIFM|nr:hypothetical protein VFMJ11_1044 [Aliivibrio fischeri MJ11]
MLQASPSSVCKFQCFTSLLLPLALLSLFILNKKMGKK